MPTYTFLNNKTSKIEEHFLTMAKYDDFTKSNPHLSRHFTSDDISLGDPVRLGIRKTDDGFKEVLSKINSANYKSNLGNKLSRR